MEKTKIGFLFFSLTKGIEITEKIQREIQEPEISKQRVWNGKKPTKKASKESNELQIQFERGIEISKSLISMNPINFQKWSREEVCMYFRSLNLDKEDIKILNPKNIEGRTLLKLSRSVLETWGVSWGGCEVILQELINLKEVSDKSIGQ